MFGISLSCCCLEGGRMATLFRRLLCQSLARCHTSPFSEDVGSVTIFFWKKGSAPSPSSTVIEDQLLKVNQSLLWNFTCSVLTCIDCNCPSRDHAQGQEVAEPPIICDLGSCKTEGLGWLQYMKMSSGFSIAEPFYSDPFGASSLAPFLTVCKATS